MFYVIATLWDSVSQLFMTFDVEKFDFYCLVDGIMQVCASLAATGEVFVSETLQSVFVYVLL